MPLYAGLMSGTSLDGMDTAFADTTVLDADPARPRFALALRHTAYAPYPDALRARLQTVRAGEGAPLVPFADYALLHSPTETRVALNLGGIANIAFLPVGGALADTLAFDTGPGNLISDGLATALLGLPYDRDGALAASGRADPALLARLLSHPYFLMPPPKSTGAELFSPAYVADFRRQAAHLSPADALATAARLTVDSIANALHDFLPRLPDRLVAGGGGTHNRALLDGLGRALPSVTIETHDTFLTHAGIIPAGAKESLAFALLAAARMHHIPANVPAATGARGPRLLGVVTLP